MTPLKGKRRREGEKRGRTGGNIERETERERERREKDKDREREKERVQRQREKENKGRRIKKETKRLRRKNISKDQHMIKNVRGSTLEKVISKKRVLDTS